MALHFILFNVDVFLRFLRRRPVCTLNNSPVASYVNTTEIDLISTIY